MNPLLYNNKKRENLLKRNMALTHHCHVNQAILLLFLTSSWGSRSPMWAGWTGLSARRGLSANLRASVHVCWWSSRLHPSVPTPHFSTRLALFPPPPHQTAWPLLPGVGVWWWQPHCWSGSVAWCTSTKAHLPHRQWVTCSSSIYFLGQ